MEEFAKHCQNLRSKGIVGGLALLALGVILCVIAATRQSPQYSHVYIGASLFVCGTICAALGELANLLGGMVRVLRGDRDAESEDAG